MKKRIGVWTAVPLVCALPLVAASGAWAAQRTFVSTTGNDANACSLTLPCRGFAKAITVTDAGGELVVLDSGGYGAVTVDKDVTILSPAGVYAGVSVFAAQDGITVTAPATRVVLRGLTINGQGGNNGIRVQAGEVHIESTVISNSGAAGILVEGGSTVRIAGTVSRSNVDGLRVAPGAGSVSVLVRDSEFSNNATVGIGVSPSAGGASARVTVERSSVTKNGAGVVASPGASATASVVLMQSVASENAGAGVSSTGSTATVYVRESAITRNGTGLLQSTSGVLNACGANLLVANALAQSGSITTANCLDVASASGTVTSVATGPGLAGGPITTTGTINLASTNLLPTTACSPTQVPQWNGSAWVCAGAATGTVTSVGTGTGLSGGPITTTGTIAADTAYLQRRVSGTCTLAHYITSIAADGTVTCGADGPANAFVQGGNAFGAKAVLGTSDSQALELNANNNRVMRYEPNAISPNVVGGSPANNVTAGVRGATIAGGGVPAGDSDPDYGLEGPNRATDDYGTIGGGYNNQAGDAAGTAHDHPFGTVVGGLHNTASGSVSTIAGGSDNNAPGAYSAIAGGQFNTASGDSSTVAGGYNNTAFGDSSFAAGSRAKANHHRSFVWGGSDTVDTQSQADGDFVVYAPTAVRMYAGPVGGGGCILTSGAGWSCASDRALKSAVVAVDARAVLDKVAALPVTEWSLTSQPAVRHVGPMAQDFHAAFGLGSDDTTITTVDAQGIALAAIQGLNAKLEQQVTAKDAAIQALEVELAELRGAQERVRAELARELAELKRTVEVLLARTPSTDRLAVR
jgi:hypothetical protein